MSGVGGGSWIPKVMGSEPVSNELGGVAAEQRIDHLILKSFRKRVTSWEEGQRIEFEYMDLPDKIPAFGAN